LFTLEWLDMAHKSDRVLQELQEFKYSCEFSQIHSPVHDVDTLQRAATKILLPRQLA
jgi:hypothetical protein